MKINSLTPAEENLMLLFWKLGTFYSKDVMEKHPEPKPHQNTISTYLKILVEKEFLKTEKEGRIFKYSTAIPLEGYRLFVLKNLLCNYFDNNAETLVEILRKENALPHKNKQPAQEKEINLQKTPPKLRSDSTAGSTEINPVADYIQELIDPKKKKDKKEKKKKDKKNKKQKP